MSLRPMKGFAQALGFLTILPVVRRWDDESAADQVGWYPSVGWLMGCAGIAVAILGSVTDLVPVLTAALVVATWAILTRFLHWDGLADSVDGLLGGRDREHRLGIMHDSHVGAFGVSALVLCMLLQVGAVMDLLSAGILWPLVAAPVFGRAAASLACWTLPAARTEGLGLAIVGPGTRHARIIASITVAGTGMLPFIESAMSDTAASCSCAVGIVLLIGVLAAFTVPRSLARSVGGMTGDLFGASVVLVEMSVLLAAALAV